jgi:CheY-like chemotaxis protein
MTAHDYRSLQVFVVDREGTTRRLLRQILRNLGVVNIHEHPSPAEALAPLAEDPADLLFVDADQGDGVPGNPFACAIAMSWQPTPSLLFRFTGSGADDLLTKPFSVNQVTERLFFMVQERKPFVVTSDYIGPDRRRGQREGIQIPLVEVPNTLRLKAEGLYDAEEVAEQAAQAQFEIDEQKVLRHGFQVAFLVEVAIPGLLAEPPDQTAIDHLIRVPGVVHDMMMRMGQGDQRSTAGRYARSLTDQVEAFLVGLPEPLQNAGQLRRDALGLFAIATQSTDFERLEREVSGAVIGYRSRLEQIARERGR